MPGLNREPTNLKSQNNEKHRRDDMSRLASGRNVQWSAEGATSCVHRRVQNPVNLFSLRSRKV